MSSKKQSFVVELNHPDLVWVEVETISQYWGLNLDCHLQVHVFSVCSPPGALFWEAMVTL